MKTRLFSLALIAALFSIGILASCNSDNDPVTPPSDLSVKAEKDEFILNLEYNFLADGPTNVRCELYPGKSWIAFKRSDVEILEKKLFDAGIKAAVVVRQPFRTVTEDDALEDFSSYKDLCWTTIRADVETAYSFPEVISALPFFTMESRGERDWKYGRYMADLSLVYLKSGASFEEYQSFAHEMGLRLVSTYEGGYMTLCTKDSKCNTYELFEKGSNAGVIGRIRYIYDTEIVDMCSGGSPRHLQLDWEDSDRIPLDGKYIIADNSQTQEEIDGFFDDVYGRQRLY